MEALAAIALAGNVLQFVSLGALVLKHVKESVDGTASQNYAILQGELEDLQKLTIRLQDQSLEQNTGRMNRGLWTQARKCEAIAEEMRKEIEKVGIGDIEKPYPTSFRTVLRTLVKSPFASRALTKLNGELSAVETQMQLYITSGQKEDLRQILQNQNQIFRSLDSVEKAIMTKLVDGDSQPLRVDSDIIMQQLRQLHTDTMQTFNERLGGIQAQLEEINGTLKQLSDQRSPHPATEVSGRALWMAVADGNESLVNSLLDRGVDTAFTNVDVRNESCLHLAASRRNAGILQALLRQNPGLNAYSDQGITPLMSATLADNPDNAEILINAGCDMEAPLRDTRDVVSGRVDIDNMITKGSTALFLAAQHGYRQLAELLIRRGAKVRVRTNHLFTPLHAATIGGHPEIVQLLLDHGADIEARTDGRFTPLIYAAHHGQNHVARVLLEYGADMEAKKSLNMTALLEAFWVQRLDTIKFLLEKGANIEGDLPDIVSHPSLLHWAIDINAAEIVRTLLERKQELQFWCRTSSVEDLLRAANRNGNPDIVSILQSYSV